MLRSAHHETAALTLVALFMACGPSVGQSDGGGSASDTAADTQSTESNSGSTAGSGCAQSDLPEPLCHELVLYGGWSGRIAGVSEQVRRGVRPLVVVDELGLELVNPLAPEEVFVRVPPPLQLEAWGSPASLSVINADFDGDATEELLICADTVHGELQLVVLDETTLDTVALRDDFSGWALKASAIDLFGDGSMEIITGEVDDMGITFRAWSLVDGELLSTNMALFPLPCSAWDFYPGDFDGDGSVDLSVVWHEDCDAYFALADYDSTQILTFFGGQASTSLDFQLSYQPPSMDQAAVGDFDGDGRAELLVAESAESIAILDWTPEGFTTTENIGAPDQGSDFFGLLLSGRYTRGGPDGVLLGPLAHEGGSDQFFYGALLLHSEEPILLMLPHDVIGHASDYNADGVSDFHVTTDDQLGIYVSHSTI